MLYPKHNGRCIKHIFNEKFAAIFIKNRVCFSCFESRTGYHFKAFLGQEQGQALGVPAAYPHPKTWGVPPGPGEIGQLEVDN